MKKNEFDRHELTTTTKLGTRTYRFKIDKLNVDVASCIEIVFKQ